MAFHAEEFAQNFGQRVRRIRKEERLTQLELSYMVGVSDKTIRDIERGKPGPSFGSVLKTAEVLGILPRCRRCRSCLIQDSSGQTSIKRDI